MAQTIILYGNRETAHRMVDCAPPGAVMTIAKPRRSLPQNARMWAMISDVSRAKPEGRNLTPEQWKCVFMDALGIKATWVPSLDGQGVVNTSYRSSQMTKEQMSDMFALIESYGAEQGIIWSHQDG